MPKPIRSLALITVAPGTRDQVVQTLREREGFQEVLPTGGEYDVVAIFSGADTTVAAQAIEGLWHSEELSGVDGVQGVSVLIDLSAIVEGEMSITESAQAADDNQ